ncbi:ABC transporter substrate-binding protein [Pusillimonas noertemannii]|uniref:ABC transporter substrate-binding protein n=1 Tax=Pusillimonas noertemannii TaxID=305977 RepID=UPI00036D3DFD|nr:ABC transporter substrate-binding protein [Pusillimonas noertemannii]
MKLVQQLRRLALAAVVGTMPMAAQADINVGVILSLTGPGASLGLPEQKAVQLWPASIAGHKLNVTVLNDATDVSQASRAASKLIAENNVDIIVGSSLTPPSLAITEVAARHSTPVISLGGGSAIVEPLEGHRMWAFKVSAPEKYAVALILDHMKQQKVGRVGAIAISTAYGEGYVQKLKELAPSYDIEVTGVERYNQTDQSVTAQATRLAVGEPDAVFIISAGTPGALPQLELKKRGYKGLVYQTQGVANNDFLRVGGKDVEGAFIALSPLMVASQLDAGNPIREHAMDFIERYENAFSPDTAGIFAASAWDAMLILKHAAADAVSKAQPGTEAFRRALRDSLENSRDVTTSTAVYNFSPTDHNGVDERSQVMARIQDGKWIYVK